MSNWPYLRWQTWRHTPLFLAIALPIGAVGFWMSSYVPLEYRSSATLMLEQAPSDTQTARLRPGESAPERLRVIAQKVRSQGRLDRLAEGLPPTAAITPDNLSLKVIAGREKATLLDIEVMAATPVAALNLNRKVLDAIRADYDASLQTRFAGASADAQALVDSLMEVSNEFAVELSSARSIAAQFSPDLTQQINARLREIDRLERRSTTALGLDLQSPERRKLEAELARALSVFSQEHPNVIRLQQQLSALPSDQLFAGDADEFSLAEEREMLTGQLNEITAATNATTALRLEHAAALRDLAQARRDLERKRRQSEATLAHQSKLLSVVASPTLPTAPAFPSPLLAQVAAALIAIALASALCWVRIRCNQVIHRPEDLERHLGITPFATLPRNQIPLTA